MGLLSKIFGSRGMSPERYGRLLAEVVRSTLGSQFQEEHVLDTKQRFDSNGWDFNYNRYSFAVMSLYIRQAILHATQNHPNDIKVVFGAFLSSIPDEYKDIGMDEDILSHMQLASSNQPELTAARLAAEKYFGADPKLEQIMYFGAIAKTFSDTLNAFEKKTNL